MNSDEIYKPLRIFMDDLSTGFPETESGVESKILKKLFSPEQAALFMELTFEPETVENIANRTGIEQATLNLKLEEMASQGLLFRESKNNQTYYQI